MGSEHGSPYWDDIVGKHWPAVPPSDWHNLQTVVRDAAEAVDPEEADRARRLFSERVPSSEGLEPAKRDMLGQQDSLRKLVDALVAASDTFGQIGDIVYRTRHRILDIVDRADADIQRVRQQETDKNGNEDEAAERRRISAIVREARDEVADVERNALKMLGPQGLPELALIAELLGRPNPWTQGNGPGGPGHPGRRQDGVPGAGAGPRHPGGGSHPQVPGPLRDPMPQFPFVPGLIRLDPGMLPHAPLPFEDIADRLRDRLFGDPPAGVDHMPAQPAGPHDQVPVAPAPAAPVGGGPAPGQSSGWAPAAPNHAGPGEIGDHTVDGAPAADSGASHEPEAPVAASASDTHTEHGSGHGTDAGHGHDENDSGALSFARSSHPDDDTDIGEPGHRAEPGTIAPIGTPGLAAGGAMSAPLVVPQSGAPGPTVSAPVERMNAPAAQAAAPPAGADTRPGPPPDSRISAPGGKGPLVGNPPGPPGSPVAAPAAKAIPPQRVPGPTGSDEVVRDAVGAAMVAASAPAFVLGERVDGDLVLARSLLSSLLAAAGESALGVDWAVSVLRHSGGVTAFVTSNEGRGWLPAGLYLPRELSTPWVWSESDDSGWEGVGDPARILAEFGIAWGAKIGARLSALVSSQPIDGALSAQLGAVPTEGSVAAAAVMDFAAPAAGLADRLELVGSAQLADRVAATPPDRIAERCVELARDGHGRGAALGRALDSLDTGTIRAGILQAITQRRAVPEPLWDELRDADALVAASMLPLRADVSRVALGELRSESGAGADAAVLRAMVCQRRCDELVLLLAGESTRQTLRDAVYAHAQLAELAAAPSGPDPTTPPPPRTSSVSVGPRGGDHR
ncbi:hypothetical protein C5E45_33080 [Nocardia nova]|uniref:Uncharacterized protein n=1 Tax=Nocardia nova TaxID=37330 RepID=A0A2S6ACR7_9NOCA|nr:hypothetical protein [Nocardia nova]PPJ19684.1 hypothetical protein C5E41_30820 [Nocardia nova]PPJ31827.1 hypothetical protein C5E45_33080 [Nocardia nova]